MVRCPGCYSLELVEGKENYANCDGIYIERIGVFLNDKQVYVCDEKRRFIGWNGSCWMLTAMTYYDEIIRHQGKNFGGYHWSVNPDAVTLGTTQWNNYRIQVPKSLKRATTAEVSNSYHLISKTGDSDYADCEGTYIAHDSITLNMKPIFICEDKQRFIGWNGDYWMLTAMDYFDDIVTTQGKGWGGYHWHTGGDCSTLGTTEWDHYQIEPV